MQIFRNIDIETTNTCNRRCDYCPVSLEARGPDAEMPSALFLKIARELGEMKYTGRINSNMYNEPMMDLRLLGFYRELKKHAPDCHIRLLTNGDYLKQDTMAELFEAGMGSIRITDHNPTPNLRLMVLVQWTLAKYRDRDITLNRLDGQLRNRGGTIEHRHAQAPQPDCWPKKHARAYIDFKGNMIGCCDDPFSSRVFGSVAESTIMDIWARPDYVKFREGLDSDKFYFEFCRKCNYNAGKDVRLEKLTV